MRILIFPLSVLIVVVAALPADAQLLKRKSTTCSIIYKRCLNYSAGYGPLEIKKCDTHRDDCLKTGEWKSRAFEYKDVERK
jgi:hypothetical protein